MEKAKHTPLYDAHLAAGGKMVEFAGYAMAVQYGMGLAKEHLWVRENAGLFDVSHMGQAVLEGEGAAEFLSFITPSPFLLTPNGNAKYTVLPNANGGIIDDLIVTRISETKFSLVFNGSRKQVDMNWVTSHLPDGLTLTLHDDRALLALQGPKAEKILSQLVSSSIADQDYMSYREAELKDGTPVQIFRLGYTGEDGFEISIHEDKATAFWNSLVAFDEVEPAGLGARDTLRLEMGYPLYGNDLNEETSPVEADISWIVSKKNNEFMGAKRIINERANGTKVKRVGIKLTERGVARGDTPIVNAAGESLGTLTSGGFSPTLNEAIGQGYVKSEFTELGTKLFVEVRGKKIAAEVTGLTFVKAKTKTKKPKQAA